MTQSSPTLAQLLDEKDDDPKKALVFKVDPDLHARFKSTCALRGLSMTRVFERLAAEWMAKDVKDQTYDWITDSGSKS